MMNTGYGMPSRRRLRGPLHPRDRPPPTSFGDASAPFTTQQHTDPSSSDMPPPSSASVGKKREWTATIGRGGLGSLPWEQMGPSLSGPPQTSSQLPSADFSFQSGMGFPTSASTASMASMASMPSSSSVSSFASFRQQQTPMSASPSSFRTAADADESSYSARSTIFSRGNQSAQAALRETSQAMYEAGATVDDPPRKRRRGLAGAIVETAVNAALYTGAAALTAYALWSSWGQSADTEDQRHHPDAGPEADMGHVISQNRRGGVTRTANESGMPPGGLDEPPPPYYEDHDTPSKPQQQQQQPSTPQSNSVRTRKVFVSSQRNRRRPTFQGSKTQRQSTSRKALPKAFRSPEPAASPGLVSSSSQDLGTADYSASAPERVDHEGGDDDVEDEQDEMFSRFEARMNALIAEGQAALNSTPVLQEADLRDIDTPSPSVGIGMNSSRSLAHPLSSRASQRFHSPSATGSPFTRHQQQTTLQPPHSSSLGVARSNSHPDQLSSDANISFLPEPVKRTFTTPTHQSSRYSHSAFDFNFRPPTAGQESNKTSPFVFGQTDSSSSLASPSIGTGSPPGRAAGRRMTDFGSVASRNGAVQLGESPYSRIPRSTSTLQARKSAVEPRPSPF